MTEIDTALPVISSFWRGRAFGWLQRACLTSFLRQGHRVVLYTDLPRAAVPPGVEIRHPFEVWQPSQAFWDAAPAVLLADLFRLRLLQVEATIWADTDAYCVRPFRFDTAHVFGFLKGGLATGVLGLPQDSPALSRLLAFALEGEGFAHWLRPNRQEQVRALPDLPPEERLLALYGIARGVMGPNALTFFGRDEGLLDRAQPEAVFYPLRPAECEALFTAQSRTITEPPEVLSVHFYGRAIQKRALLPRGEMPVFEPESFVAQAVAETQDLWE